MPTEPENTPRTAPILSEFASDPDMQEILVLFVQEMPERVEQLQRAWRANELDQVKRLAHQLKGAGGGYGYPTVGDAAGQLESSLNQLQARSQAQALDQIRAQLDSLVDLCNRVA